MNNSPYEIEIKNKGIHPMQPIWKTAWTFVPFTFAWWTFATFRTT